MEIVYQTDVVPETGQVITLYKSSGLNRPVDDEARIAQMYRNSNLVLTAWHGDTLVGVPARLAIFVTAVT